MIRNTLFMFTSTILRFINGVLLFVIMARFWGPEIFGVFMYPYTLAAILVILVDYGFNLQLVTDIGKNTHDAHRLTCQALIIKNLLVLIVAAVGLPLLILLKSLDGYRVLLVMLIFSFVLNSYGMLFNLSFRGMGRFDKEAIAAFWSNITAFLLIGGLVLFGQGPVTIALGFVFSKAFFGVLSWLIYKQLIGGAKFIYSPMRIVLKVLRDGFFFAAHVALGTLYFSVDTIIIKHFLGAENVGIYQAGLRVMVGCLILVDVLSNVYLSRMAKDSYDRKALISLSTRMTRHCLMIGVFIFIFMIGFSDLIVKFIYGSNGFTKVIPLFPLFGVVLLLRYLGASYGILLTVDNRQVVRMVGVGLSVVVSVTLNILLIPKFNLNGALIASIITHVFLTGIYIFFAWRQVQNWLMEKRSWLLISIASLAGLFQLFIIPEYYIVRYTVIIGALLFVGFVGISSTEYSNLMKRLQRHTSSAT